MKLKRKNSTNSNRLQHWLHLVGEAETAHQPGGQHGQTGFDSIIIQRQIPAASPSTPPPPTPTTSNAIDDDTSATTQPTGTDAHVAQDPEDTSSSVLHSFRLSDVHQRPPATQFSQRDVTSCTAAAAAAVSNSIGDGRPAQC